MVFWYQWDYLRSPAKILFCRVSGRLAMVLNWMIILLAVLNRVGWTNVVPTGGETPSMEFLWDFYVDQWFWAGLVGNSWQFQPGFYLPSVRYGWWDTSIVPSTASLPYPYFLADNHRSPCHKQTGMFLLNLVFMLRYLPFPIITYFCTHWFGWFILWLSLKVSQLECWRILWLCQTMMQPEQQSETPWLVLYWTLLIVYFHDVFYIIYIIIYK